MNEQELREGLMTAQNDDVTLTRFPRLSRNHIAAILTFILRNKTDTTEIAGTVEGLKALDNEHLRSPFNACSLKGRCIQTADELDRQHDGHAEFVRAVRKVADTPYWHQGELLEKIVELCDAELAKEKNNG